MQRLDEQQSQLARHVENSVHRLFVRPHHQQADQHYCVEHNEGVQLGEWVGEQPGKEDHEQDASDVVEYREVQRCSFGLLVVICELVVLLYCFELVPILNQLVKHKEREP